MGMTLDESIENLETYKSNGLDIYLEEGLDYLIRRFGKISVDYIKPSFGNAGFSVRMTGLNQTDC